MTPRIFLIVILLATSGIAQAQRLTNKLLKDTLVWVEGHHLAQEDFEGKAKGKAEATTSGSIFLYTKEENGQMKFVVEAIFIKSKSFIKSSSEYILKHEQLHFDIYELYARKLRKKIAEKNFAKSRNISQEIQLMYHKIFEECVKEQEKYDRETENSMNMVKQEIWKNKISAELAALSAYAYPVVDVVN